MCAVAVETRKTTISSKPSTTPSITQPHLFHHSTRHSIILYLNILCINISLIHLFKHYTHTHKYNNSGIYQMKCLDCPFKYIGQTGRIFNFRYKVHTHVIRNNNCNYGYSNHILNTGQTYRKITDTMDVIRTGRKGRHLNTLEKYHIYKISRNNLQMSDTHIDTQSRISDNTQTL
jgi:hypothetical protein